MISVTMRRESEDNLCDIERISAKQMYAYSTRQVKNCITDKNSSRNSYNFFSVISTQQNKSKVYYSIRDIHKHWVYLRISTAFVQTMTV